MNVFLGMMYIDKYIQGISLVECKILLKHSTPVALFETGTEPKMTSELTHKVRIDELDDHAGIRVDKLSTSPAGAESLVVVVTSNCGLMTIEQIQTTKQTQLILPVPVIYDAHTISPFQILVANFSTKAVVLHMYMRFASGTGS